MLTTDKRPHMPNPHDDIVNMVKRLGLEVLDPNYGGWGVLAKISDRCTLRIEDLRNPDPRDAEYAGICMNFSALRLPEQERRAYTMNLSEAMRFAQLPASPPPDFPDLGTCERILRALCTPLDCRLQQYDSVPPSDLRTALHKNRFRT